MIEYQESANSVLIASLTGFFSGWPNPPVPETHLRVLRSSDEVVLAIDTKSAKVVGFITAITDGVLTAYIPLLEVLPKYRHQGIGAELVRRMLRRLDHLYMIGLLCDPDIQPFYRALGMSDTTGMVIRNYEHQSGASEVSRDVV